MDNDQVIEKAKENAKDVHLSDGVMLTVKTAVSGITPYRTLKGVAVIDEQGNNLSQEASVKNPMIQTLPTDSLKFVKRAKDRVKATFRKYGFDFGKETYCVSASKAKDVYEKLAEIRGAYEADLADFLDNYDDLVEEQALLNPDSAELIRIHATKKGKIGKSFNFYIAPPRAIKIHADAFAEIEAIPGLDIDAQEDAFTQDIVHAFCKEARHFWHYNLRNARQYYQDDEFKKLVDEGKRGMKPTALKHLADMQLKLADAELVNPRIEILTQKVKDVIDLLPVGWDGDYDRLISGKELFKQMLKSFALLKEEDYIFTLLEAQSDDLLTLEDSFIQTEMDLLEIDLLEIDLELETIQTNSLSAVNQPEFESIDVLDGFDLGLDYAEVTKVEAAPKAIDIFEENTIHAFDDATLSLDEIFENSNYK